MRRDFSLLEVVVLEMSLHLHLRGGVVEVLLRVGWRFLFSNGRCSMGRKKKMRKNWRGQRKIENSEKRMALQQGRERENGILKKGGNEACFYRSMFCRLVKQAPLPWAIASITTAMHVSDSSPMCMPAFIFTITTVPVLVDPEYLSLYLTTTVECNGCHGTG